MTIGVLAVLGLSWVGLAVAGFALVGRLKYPLYRKWLYFYSAIMLAAVLVLSLR